MSYDVHNIWNEIYKAENGKWSNICYISGQTYRCEPCNIILSIDKVLAHVMDASHQEAIREPKNVRTNETLMQIAADIWQKIHAADRTHEVCFKIDTCTVIYCTFCCVKVPASIDNVVDHIRGKNHMATVTKTLISSQHSCVMKQGNCSDEGKSPSPKPTKNQTLTGRRLSESAPSKDLLNSKSSQPQICKTSYDVQEALVNALMPNPKGISCQSTSMLKEKSVSFICVICDSKFESEELWCQHTCSRGHRIQAGNLLTEGKNLVSHKCFGCGAMVYCIQSDFAKHNCLKVENFVPSNNILGEIAGNDQQINESNATESFHKGNVKWKEQDEITDNVPRIIVHGYPKHFGLERLFNFFKDFGSVSFIVVTDGSAIIEFTENASVERALARPLFIGEAALTVKSLTNFVHQVPEPTVSVHESLVSTFTSPQRVEEKLNALCTASSSLSDPEKHEQVCLFLEESCTEIFPGCKAIPFGSRVSGLALHDSDLDVFLDTGDMYGGKQNQESAIQELIVSSTGNRLINHPECCNVQEIRNARTPIVKFFYKPIETQCDVAFSHGLGCENTMLIKFYLSLDPRVRPVIIFLKHWAHIHQLIGQSKITNYALAWLVIFYLQKVSGFGLPTVRVLHKLHKGPEKLIAGWECSFNVNKLKIPRINNSQRILQLLHGFFHILLQI
ncbi:uncharacterized protein LOC110838598 [Zootermopsis nevadensis]|uniref:Poly(A) RNA polymerase, mitochondrial n=1 Tax=Zootermopsis nevadensis TaxID=136037 RepID=A0A067QV08_ZOONE|nr:uncharacterized protein LOC110838598 [Zootermopsis nevadensis]KDR09603.1 Poly(A) RNA polymerase, mitochondrial [Zootermopsis nevadensis]